ncbi:hypothetical protein [Cyclobacterium roseum]|uniref:hypothetical protein n=1 Tax=Cyclobacterium roseum TaxID=2666137 RepID=UPI001390971B|nr:hypothetical protein [Cyclobacterium roseum]
MITPKIIALFQFIDYLHANIENFRKYDRVLDELYLLGYERKLVSPQKNFKDKLKYDELQEQIKGKFKVIKDNILQPILSKAIELNICDPNKTETLWNWNSTEINKLKKNFSKDDLPEILIHKNRYLEYRKKTKGEAFFGLGFFFDDLDELLKSLFDFFKETEHNEFEPFETKTIQVSDISEAVKLFQSGLKKFTLPISFLNPSTIQQHPNIESLSPQPIVKQKPELNGKLITFKNSDTIDKIHTELKGYFPNKEAELLKALQGEQLSEILLFPHNQNKFVEVFKRLKYNGFLISTPKEINTWICSNFAYVRKLGDKKEVKNFNESTIKTHLTNSAKEREAEPTPKERICTPNWLPHYWSSELKNKQN